MHQLKPQQSLNPAYRKVKPNRSSVSNFVQAFQQCLEAIRLSDSHNESEEHIKLHLSSFFKDTFYQDYYINTKDRIDLAIYLGKNAKSNIGVLLEAKRLSNKAEFPTTQNLNKKAIQELLLYYLRERIDHKNNNIKQLVATNGVEWFLFKGEDFYAHFYKNKALVKEYEAFRDGKKDSTNNELFYKEIAAPFIAKIQEELPFVYLDFNAIQFEKLSDKQLNNLYKLFSPVHWLGERFGNDSNQLNKAFYNELLHIIGLTETKKGSKKLIERLPPKERNEGSLLENAMEQIDFRDKLSQFKKPSQLGATREEQIFHLALDLCITWVNRILFLKLLEAQLIQYNQDKARFSFLNAQIIENFDELDSLFFQVLAKQPKERLERVQQKYADVPYLNSSLFEPTEHEQKGLFITELDNRREIPVYGKTKLKDQQNKTEKGNLHTLTYLFRFLDAYDFASDGEESIQEENKSLINASVLGLIFEKINGYKDGSFFTPGFITMYMCRETIRKAVLQKFSEAKQQEFTDFEDLKSYCFHYYKKEDKLAFNQLVNSLKICDPAVGSGHFLVSALNELITVKSELGILIDENGLPLKIEVSVVNDELVITDEEGDLFDYKINQPESFRIQRTLFHEKQSLIENSLFGVDINPNSVKICRLRLWIELLKHAYYKKDSSELETLPNIDINIKTGNSLISRFDLDADLGKALKESKWNIGAYRDAVQTYRNARNKDEKRAMMRLIKDIKSNFRSEINANDPKKLRLEKAKGELFNMTQQTGLFEKTKSQQKAWKKKVDQLSKTTKKLETELQEIKDNKIYENAFEWRFEFPEVLDEKGNFTGFDVVIGNPPYGLFNKKQNKKVALTTDKLAIEELKLKYPEATGGVINAARIFYAFGLKISSKNGFQSMIIPYGVLTDTTSVKLRKHIFFKHSLIKAEAFPERDNSKRRVFEDVKMSTAILLTSTAKFNSSFDIGVSYNRKISDNRAEFKIKELVELNPDMVQIPLTDTASFKLLTKIYKTKDVIKFGKISPCLTGEVDMTFGKSALNKDKTKTALFKGVQIDRYIMKTLNEQISQGDIEYIDESIFNEIGSSKKIEDSKHERIALQGLTGVNEKYRLKATYVEGNIFLANSCNYLLKPKYYDLKLLLGWFNSSLLNFVFKTTSTSSNVNGYEVDNLPFIDSSKNDEISAISNQILEIKNDNIKKDSSELERKINNIIYDIFELTSHEIDIIEKITQ